MYQYFTSMYFNKVKNQVSRKEPAFLTVACSEVNKTIKKIQSGHKIDLIFFLHQDLFENGNSKSRFQRFDHIAWRESFACYFIVCVCGIVLLSEIVTILGSSPHRINSVYGLVRLVPCKQKN